MKRILILLAVLLPIFTSVSVDALKKDNFCSSKVVGTSGYNVFARVTIDASDISLPLTITVPAPAETIIKTNGPSIPNVPNWKVENGYLTIVYTNQIEIIGLEDRGTFMIEVVTEPLRNYTIELTVE